MAGLLHSDLAQDTIETWLSQMRASMKVIFDSIVGAAEKWSEFSPDALISQHDEILQAVNDSNESGTVHQYTQEQINFLNKYFDRDSPFLWIGVPQSNFIDAFQDWIYGTPVMWARAFRTINFNEWLWKKEFARLLQEYCTTKGFQLQETTWQYEFKYDASNLLEAMKRNREILAMDTLKQEIDKLLLPLISKIQWINSRWDVTEADVEMLDRHLLGTNGDRRYKLDISSDQINGTAINPIMQSHWSKVSVLRNNGAKWFIWDALKKLWEIYEQEHRWKLWWSHGDPDGLGLYPNLRLVSMHPDELTTQEKREREEALNRYMLQNRLTVLAVLLRLQRFLDSVSNTVKNAVTSRTERIL